MSNITPYFGETMKSGSGVVAVADYSGYTNVAGLYGPLGVGGFSSGQFQFVTVGAYSGTGESTASLAGATIVSVAGQGGVKVLGNKPQQGDPCQLFDIGEVKVVAGGALTVGSVVMSDVDGRAVTYVNNGTNVPVGECRVPANSANDICTIFIYPNMAEGDAPALVFPANAAAVSNTTGTSKANAATSTSPLGYGFNAVTTISGAGYSLLLPPAFAGAICVVSNQSAGTSAADLYGQGTDTIDGVATATAISLAEASTLGSTLMFFGVAAGQWISAKGTNQAAT